MLNLTYTLHGIHIDFLMPVEVCAAFSVSYTLLLQLVLMLMCFVPALFVKYRCFLKINPDHGRKTSQRGKAYTSMSAKVLALINHIADHEWTEE